MRVRTAGIFPMNRIAASQSYEVLPEEFIRMDPDAEIDSHIVIFIGLSSWMADFH